MIYIYDFEDGLQHIISHMIGKKSEIRYWDRRGFFSEIDTTGDKNIIILSKPYDCLQRGMQRDKYKSERGLEDWSRRNWRYSNPEIYEHINSIISKIDDKLIIHPDDLLTGNIRKKIKNYIDVDIKIDDSRLEYLYRGNVDIK